MLGLETVLFLVAGAVLAGVAMGLVGFGVGLAALGIWLLAIEARLAVPLICICSLATTAFTLHLYWHAISLRRLAPFLLGSLVGLPAGAALLTRLDPGLFKFCVGAFLIAYALFRLLLLPRLQIRRLGRKADAAVGAATGLLGGFAAIPGPISIAWCGLQGWDRHEQRGVYQPLNQFILLLALVLYAREGMLTAELGIAALYAIPACLVGIGVGSLGYKRLDEARFQRAVLLLLLASGIMLVVLNR